MLSSWMAVVNYTDPSLCATLIIVCIHKDLTQHIPILQFSANFTQFLQCNFTLKCEEKNQIKDKKTVHPP